MPCKWAAGWKYHRPGNVRYPPPQFAVDEVSKPAETEADGNDRSNVVGNIQVFDFIEASKDEQTCDQADKTTVE